MPASLLAAAALLQASTALPLQSPGTPALVRRAPAHSVKDGGTYHVATGTWSRAGRQRGMPAGSEVIFSNTSNPNDFYTVGIGSLQLPGQIAYDEGVLPTPSNGTVGFGTPPDRVDYTVTGFEIRYCDFDPTPMSSDWIYHFYESFDPAADPRTGPATPHVVNLTGLPSQGCWTITVDLSGGAEFTLQGDGGVGAPGWNDDPTLDSFTYGVEYAGALGHGPAAGVFFAGDPEFTGGAGGFGAGTYYLDPEQQGTSCGTTGLGALDGWTLTVGGTVRRTPPIYSNGVGCGAGLRPYGSTYLRLFGTVGPGADVGSSYCAAAPNSTGNTGAISAVGRSIASSDRLTLMASDLPPNQFGFFLVSRDPDQDNNPGGSAGNLCVGGTIGRLDDPGQVLNSGPMGMVSLSTEMGQWSLAAQPLGGGVASAMAGETWYYQFWHRDLVGGSSSSNFTQGLQVDFN